MTIASPLAQFIADNAINAPFRQIHVQNTPEFRSWLSSAGIRLQETSLFHLWVAGVIRPVAISMSHRDLFDSQRFSAFANSLDIPANDSWSLDLGKVVSADAVQMGSLDFGAGRAYVRQLWWHRFQVWEMERLNRVLASHISLDQGLHGPEATARLVERVYEGISDRIAEWANSDERATWEKVLALLLYVEPLVHLAYAEKVRLPGWGDTDIGDYFSWLEAERIEAQSALERVGLTLEEAKEWHKRLNTSAVLIDPVSHFRPLLRFAGGDAKARLKGDALRADALYEAAEVLRRYLEISHDMRLAEETGSLLTVADSPSNPMLYGGERLLDFDRKVFRRIVRRFGLDPQARLTWLVEGDTEVGLAERLAERYGTTLEEVGMDVMNIRGLGGLNDNRTASLLERLKNEEVFVYVSVDRDAQAGQEHLRQLKQYARSDLLVGFELWEPDLEDANFTRSELAQIATDTALAEGIDLKVSEQDLEQEVHRNKQRVPVGTAIARLLARQGCRNWKTGAGGRLLADWIMDVPCPPEKAVDGERPILKLYLYLLRAQTSDYWQTYRLSDVADDGALHPRTSL